MDNEDITIRASAEIERLTQILEECNISKRRMDALKPVVENTAWMKVKLDDSRAAIKNAQIVITYNNGGGQKGIRENPLFRGYEALWKSYMAGMNRILECLPEEVVQAQVEVVEKQTALDLIRKKRRESA